MSPGTGTVRECRSHLAGAAFQKLSREGQGSSRAQCWGWTGAQNQRDKGPVGVRAPSPPRRPLVPHYALQGLGCFWEVRSRPQLHRMCPITKGPQTLSYRCISVKP